MAFAWIPFYKEFAQKLLKFRSNRKPLGNDYISSGDSISEGGTKTSIARLQDLELLKRKGGKKNGEWIVSIDI